jgi:hypothetical protein
MFLRFGQYFLGPKHGSICLQKADAYGYVLRYVGSCLHVLKK